MSAQSLSILNDALQRLILGFFMDLDTGRFEELAARMASGGEWHRQGKVLSGRDSILQAMAERGPDVRTAHLVMNFQIGEADEKHAEVRFYMVVYRHEGQIVAGTPSPMGPPVSVGLYEARCVLVEDEWRIVKLNSQPLFRD